MIRLYSAPWSTNVERVALALAHKGLEVESVLIDYSDRSPVLEVSGQPLVPVIDHDDELFHSILDEPQSVEGRPRLRVWIDRVDERPRAY
jgi:glutathione S-transferase